MYLSRLRIRNLALVRELDREFPKGIISVTGETGAGKSTILGSIQLLLGERADLSLVRQGCEKAFVEGVFEFDRREGDLKRLSALAEEGFPLTEGEPLIVRREIWASGRTAVFFADHMVTVKRLSELMGETVDIHSQHAQQSLTKRSWQRLAFDTFAKAQKEAALVREAYEAWQQAKRELEDYEAKERETRRQEDLWRFELAEVEAAKLREGEEDELCEKERSLSHAEEILSLLSGLQSGLGGDENGPLQGLRQLNRILRQLQPIYRPAEEWQKRMNDAIAILSDLGDDVETALGKVEVSPGELEAVQERLANIDGLKKKYGASIAEILKEAAEIKGRLENLGSFEERLCELKKAEESARENLGRAAEALTKARKKAQKGFSKAVEEEISHLGMQGMHFEAIMEPLPEPGPFGAESVEFAIANQGQPLMPLSKIASGGELSRLTLALKCLSMSGNDVQILFFDEIDAGISATVAGSIGDKMRLLGEDHQVFVITHMPVIAAAGDSHYSVSKEICDGETMVEMRAVEGDERLKELSRMLGGDIKEASSYALKLLEKYHPAGAGK